LNVYNYFKKSGYVITYFTLAHDGSLPRIIITTAITVFTSTGGLLYAFNSATLSFFKFSRPFSASLRIGSALAKSFSAS